MHEHSSFFDAAFHNLIKILKKQGNIFRLAVEQRIDDVLDCGVVLKMFEMGSGRDDCMVGCLPVRMLQLLWKRRSVADWKSPMYKPCWV